MFNFLKRRKRIQITGECLCCGKCCQNLILIDRGKPITHIRQFIRLKKSNPAYARFHFVYKDDSDGLLYFSCDQLNDENKCDDHLHRLALCKKYPNTKMLKYGGRLLEGCGFRIQGAADFKEMLDQEMKKPVDPTKKDDWYLIE